MQEFIELPKESLLKLLRKEFIGRHNVTPEDAQVARAIVVQNQLIISHFIKNKQVTNDQLDQIYEDGEIQERYRKMWNAMEINEPFFKLLFDDIKPEPDLFCGWLDFYNESLSETLQLNLMPATRDAYNYQDYLEGSPLDY